MKNYCRLISLAIVLLLTVGILAACGGSASSEPVDDGNLYPVGNGYLRFFSYQQEDSAVALNLFVQDNHFTKKDFEAFVDAIVVDGCTRMGVSDTFNDEGYQSDNNLIMALYMVDTAGNKVTKDDIHLPKRVEVEETTK